MHQQIIAAHIAQGEAGVVGQALGWVAGDDTATGQGRGQFAQQAVAQRSHVGQPLCLFDHRQAERLDRADDQGDVGRPGAQTALVATAG